MLTCPDCGKEIACWHGVSGQRADPDAILPTKDGPMTADAAATVLQAHYESWVQYLSFDQLLSECVALYRDYLDNKFADELADKYDGVMPDLEGEDAEFVRALRSGDPEVMEQVAHAIDEMKADEAREAEEK